MTTTRFDPAPGRPWGTCITCEAVLQTYADAKAHMDESMGTRGEPGYVGRSHQVRGTNPDREQRIGSFVDQAVDDALQELFRSLDDEIDRDNLTEDELTEALRNATADLLIGWKRYTES